MSGRRSFDEPGLTEPTDPDPASPSAPKHAPGTARPSWRAGHVRPGDGNGNEPSGGARRFLRRARSRLARWRHRASDAFVRSLPKFSRALRALGILALLFVVFVVAFGAMRHTTRQAHLDEAFRTRVAGGHADGPNWRPLPGQAIATISIPSIGLREVVVQDTTPQLLESGPGHLLGTPLPGDAGNVVILGRRITDGAVFRNLGELAPGDRITVVTPQGAFAYTVSQVSHVRPGQADALAQTSEARLTLVTWGSWFFSRDRLAVVATLEGTPAPPAPLPEIELQSSQLGGSGDSSAIVPMLPWAAALLLALLAWTRARRSIHSRQARFVVAAPVLLFLLFFLFENAANLLPGTI
jgi:sortase A